ncbi:MAG: capsule assembly Wzi family protein [Chlorobi bacterium]|nr:capsule assembly Wzi family protein [Chlorobiota bacterium]
MKKYILILLLIPVALLAQEQKLQIEVSAYGGAATDSLQPLWNYANDWGLFNHLTEGEGLLKGSVNYDFLQRKNISMRAGIAGIAKTDLSGSFIQEAFIHMKFWWLDISGGMEAYSPVAYDDNLSSGTFLISSNPRPVPGVTAGIYNYLPLGFTGNWLEIRGGMSQGFLIDDRGPKGNSNVLLHEKWAYFRLGNTKWQPYLGLVHSALFGGTKPNGEKIPIDFWATFTASGSSKLGGGEETNAAGAHMGMYDVGVYFPLKSWQGHFYYYKPFADGSGMKIKKLHKKDFYLGLLIKSLEKKIFSGFSVEFIKTSYQSGPGTPDPYDPVEKHIVFISDIDDVDAYMMDRFGIETNGWGPQKLRRFLEDEWNYGYEFGGRDDYMNNGMYYAGWTNNGISMGTPLFHTADQVQLYAPGWDFIDRMMFINNRVDAFHVGVEGWLNEGLYYRFKGTYTNNKGNYGEEYYGRYSWEKTPDYFFEVSKYQFYTGLNLNWHMQKNFPIVLTGTLGYDFGELYNSFGGRFGIVYKISPF